MSTAEKRRYSPEEYLAFERASETKHEYFDGEIFAMPLANRDHCRIVVNLVRLLATRFHKEDVDVLCSQMRVKIPHARAYVYPDIVIVCGKAELEDDHQDTLLNPAALIEVYSPATEASDRGMKFEAYRTLPSLKEYGLVSEERCFAQVFSRHAENAWLFRDAHGRDDCLDLRILDFSVPLAEVCRRVEGAAPDLFALPLRNDSPAS